MPPGYLYILRSTRSGRYYIGSCLDPVRRLREHNTGRVRATRNEGPWERVALVPFPTVTAARRAEHYLKGLKKREVLDKVVAGRFEWPPDTRPASPDPLTAQPDRDFAGRS